MREHRAVMTCENHLRCFSAQAQTPRDTATQKRALHNVDDAITLPPRTSMFVTVMSDIYNSSSITKASLLVLLARQICVAFGIAQLKRRMTELMVMKFSSEYQHLTK